MQITISKSKMLFGLTGCFMLVGCNSDPTTSIWKDVGAVAPTSTPTQPPSTPLDFLLIRSQGDAGEPVGVQIEAIRILALTDDPRAARALNRAARSTEDGGVFSSSEFSWHLSDGRKALIQTEVAHALALRLAAHKS